MPALPDAITHSLAFVRLFAELPPSARDALAAASRVRRYPKGQVLCSEGDAGDSLLILESGQVRVSRYSRDGQEVVLSTVDAPAAFGELALIDGAPRSATITATERVSVRLVERVAFLEAIEREPALAIGLLRTLAGMVRATNERLSDLHTLDVPGRLAKWLLARPVDQPPVAGTVVPFPMSQGELAAELGATRVSVNRALKRFERLGTIVVERDRIFLLKPEDLADAALS